MAKKALNFDRLGLRVKEMEAEERKRSPIYLRKVPTKLNLTGKFITRPPITERQKAFMLDLGLAPLEGMSFIEAHKLISAELALRRKKEIDDFLEKKRLGLQSNNGRQTDGDRQMVPQFNGGRTSRPSHQATRGPKKGPGRPPKTKANGPRESSGTSPGDPSQGDDRGEGVPAYPRSGDPTQGVDLQGLLD